LKQILDIFRSDYTLEPDRLPPVSEQDWHQWLEKRHHDPDTIEVLAHYAAALFRAGVDLTNLDLIDTINGHLWHLEDAILITLSKKDLENATWYMIQVLRSQVTLEQYQDTGNVYSVSARFNLRTL